jgi:excisionase family DNA binding protein
MLSIREAARLLSCSDKAVHKYIRRRELAAVNIRGTMLIHPQHLRDFIVKLLAENRQNRVEELKSIG